MEKIQQALEALDRLLKNAYPHPRELSGPIFDAETVRDCLNTLSKLNETACETDTYIRKAAREVLTEHEVDGDSWGVPPLEEVVDLLVKEIKRIRILLRLDK